VGLRRQYQEALSKVVDVTLDKGLRDAACGIMRVIAELDLLKPTVEGFCKLQREANER
jgi:hypothetical protein